MDNSSASDFDFFNCFKKYNRTESQNTTLRTAKEFKNYQPLKIPTPLQGASFAPPIQSNAQNQFMNNQNSTVASELSLFGGCGISGISGISPIKDKSSMNVSFPQFFIVLVSRNRKSTFTDIINVGMKYVVVFFLHIGYQ